MKIKKTLSESCDMINIQKSRLTAMMTLILSFLALYASLAGVLDKNLYTDVFFSRLVIKIFNIRVTCPGYYIDSTKSALGRSVISISEASGV